MSPKRILFWLSVSLLFVGCGGDEATTDTVVVGGAPIESPPDPTTGEQGGRDVFQSDIGFFPNAGQLPSEGVSGLETPAPDDLPDGVTGLSWRDLSLRDLYGAELRKLLFPDKATGEAASYPDEIRRLDGGKVAIIGYMIPLEWGDDRVPQFLLVRDLMACCFGGTPMADEWIEVTMAGEAAEYVAYEPVVVVGEMAIGAFEDEWGFAVGCYRIRAESVTAWTD